jgi:hypothetical protein
VRSLLHIEPRDLTFTEQPDGSHQSVIDVAAVTFPTTVKLSSRARTACVYLPPIRTVDAARFYR